MRATGQHELLAWVRQAIVPGGSACRRLSIFVHPGLEAALTPAAPLPPGAVEVRDLDELKATLRQHVHEPRPLPPLEGASK